MVKLGESKQTTANEKTLESQSTQVSSQVASQMSESFMSSNQVYLAHSCAHHLYLRKFV